MIKSNFRDWNLDKVDEAFGMKQVFEHILLTELATFQHELSDFEKQYLVFLKDEYQLGGDDWNEVELENKFISPLIVFSKISNVKFAYFLERDLAVTIGEYELSGRVDGMIATGFRSPKKPLFCMNEYKRESDPNGDPRGQALIEMVAAQAINNNAKPIYGLYVVGNKWRFMVLEGLEYAFSASYLADTDDIFDIYRILKGLRVAIEKLI